MIKTSVPTKPISRIFYIYDLGSGHFCDLPVPIISQRAKNQLHYTYLFNLAQAYLSRITSYRTVVDNSSKNLHCLPLGRSFEVTNCHLPTTFDPKELEMWNWSQYVRLGQANRLICNMTHFGHHVLAQYSLNCLHD